MNLEIQSRLSFYRRLEEVEHKKGISLVRHIETGQIYECLELFSACAFIEEDMEAGWIIFIYSGMVFFSDVCICYSRRYIPIVC